MEKIKSTLGRRKQAVTRVFMKKGDGTILVNDLDYKEYFKVPYLQNQVELPLKLTETTTAYTIKITASGGGLKGQAEAAKLGIARALVVVNENYKPALKAAGVLTRDPRNVERKKFGHKKARKSFQFSKR